MTKKVIAQWDERKQILQQYFAEHLQSDYDSYKKIFEIVCKLILTAEEIDVTKIHEIDEGDYQGTLLFVVPVEGYQPAKFFVTTVGYGSCSGCDTLQGIHEYGTDELPSDGQVSDYMTLALHMIQKMKIHDEYEPS